MQKRIGEFLVEKGVLTQPQLQLILSYAHKNHLRFGDAGMALNIITPEKLIEVFGPGYRTDFFHLDSNYYPAITKELFSVDQMIKWGALPLGYKNEHKLFGSKRILNIGMLDPSQKDVIGEIENFVKPKTELNLQGIKLFLILADPYLDVLQNVYGIREEQIRNRDEKQLDKTLAMYVEGNS